MAAQGMRFARIHGRIVPLKHSGKGGAPAPAKKKSPALKKVQGQAPYKAVFSIMAGTVGMGLAVASGGLLAMHFGGAAIKGIGKGFNKAKSFAKSPLGKKIRSSVGDIAKEGARAGATDAVAAGTSHALGGLGGLFMKRLFKR
jgi:hypothetical protein